jgi:hypothetical protein
MLNGIHHTEEGKKKQHKHERPGMSKIQREN